MNGLQKEVAKTFHMPVDTEAYPNDNTHYREISSEYADRSTKGIDIEYLMDEDDQLPELSQSMYLSSVQERCRTLSKRIKKSTHKKMKKASISPKNHFTVADDLKVFTLVQELGPKFHQFGKLFPGKTMNCIKNRYYKVIRYKQEELLAMQNNPCQMNVINSMERIGLSPDVESILSNFMVQLSSLVEQTLGQ